MSTHGNHHFVPVFLLKQWRAGKDNKLTVFKRLPDGSLHHDLLGPKSVAHERHLYSTSRSSGLPDVSIEKKFLAKLVDDPAGKVHQQMLQRGLQSLSGEQRKVWAIFLLASLFRLPALVDSFRAMGRRELLEQFKSMASISGNTGADEVFQQPKYKDLLDDHGMRTFMNAITSIKHIEWICNASWSIREMPASVGTALIGDLPVGLFGELMENNFGIIAPISPRHYFICTSSEKYHLAFAMKHNQRELLKSTNKWLVLHAMDYVYATDRAHEPLIKKHLGSARGIHEEREANAVRAS